MGKFQSVDSINKNEKIPSINYYVEMLQTVAPENYQVQFFLESYFVASHKDDSFICFSKSGRL